MGDQHHAPAALPPGKARYPLYRRLGGPQGRTGRVRKISPPPSPTGIRSPDRPSRSVSLYRLSYRHAVWLENLFALSHQFSCYCLLNRPRETFFVLMGRSEIRETSGVRTQEKRGFSATFPYRPTLNFPSSLLSSSGSDLGSLQAAVSRKVHRSSPFLSFWPCGT